MSIILALIAGLAGAALGFAAGATLGSLLAQVLSISSFEGGAGYFTVAIGIAGGVVGFFIGAALTLRRYGGYRGFGAITSRLMLVVLVFGILAAIGILMQLASVEHFRGANPLLQFEIRLPEGANIPEKRNIDFEMQAGSQRSGGLLADAWLDRDGGRPVLRGLVQLYTRTSQRTLVVSLPNTPKLLFHIRLASTPPTAETYGDWQRVNLVDDGKANSQPRKPDKAETYDIRYYVSR